jgi:hypothetical protein
VKLKVNRKLASTLRQVGFILVLLGGIIILVFGVLDLLGVAFRIFRGLSVLSFVSGTASALIQIVIGAVCMIGSRFISGLLWVIILLILGLVAGTLGGSVVIVGALLGLVAVLLKSTPK